MDPAVVLGCYFEVHRLAEETARRSLRRGRTETISECAQLPGVAHAHLPGVHTRLLHLDHSKPDHFCCGAADDQDWCEELNEPLSSRHGRLKPELVIFNVEIFHALYVSCSMQNATYLETTITIISIDAIRAWLSILDTNALISEIEQFLRDNSLCARPEQRTLIDVCLEVLDDSNVSGHRRMSSRATVLSPEQSFPWQDSRMDRHTSSCC